MDKAEALNMLVKIGAKNCSIKMCNGCAFKKGSEANTDADTIEKAMNALLSPNIIFMCHENISKRCAGYEMALNNE